ncbi:sporulation related protein [Litoreibacter halocynthiae]|uniref:Sporulation related protein n=1 Tax=Litoreibacter halocynthiae TaxID=1242689 RepID=A0A4R7LMN1_9RHOB|nr:SPOR domain-containing protein [Litoreibacter halocynthiae]TDT77268.1 sporulation related protein [Litoreibacter halocynthiae]
MADMEFGAFEAPATPQQGGFSRMMNLVGAGSSVVLVLGLAVWGYQLTVRDVTDVPVIRALEGPARVQPADPGGQLAQHTGLAVNSVQSEGEAEGPTPQVILAPEPIDLTQEDAIVASPSEIEVEAEGVVEEAVGTMVSLNGELRDDDDVASALALADRMADGVEPLESTAPAEDKAALNLARPILDPKVPGVSRSPVPARKPKVDLAALQAQAAVASAVSAVGGGATEDVDPASIVSGTRLVQLGAFDDAETARAEWDKIAARFENYIDGKSRVIQEATSGGRKFYRLRAVGFDDLNASRRFCAVLVAGKAACIPVLAR